MLASPLDPLPTAVLALGTAPAAVARVIVMAAATASVLLLAAAGSLAGVRQNLTAAQRRQAGGGQLVGDGPVRVFARRLVDAGK